MYWLCLMDYGSRHRLQTTACCLMFVQFVVVYKNIARHTILLYVVWEGVPPWPRVSRVPFLFSLSLSVRVALDLPLGGAQHSLGFGARSRQSSSTRTGSLSLHDTSNIYICENQDQELTHQESIAGTPENKSQQTRNCCCQHRLVYIRFTYHTARCEINSS